MEPTYHDTGFAEALRGRLQTGKLAQHGLDNPLANREFVHAARLADGKEPVNKGNQYPKLGYELMKRFCAIMHERMHAARCRS